MPVQLVNKPSDFAISFARDGTDLWQCGKERFIDNHEKPFTPAPEHWNLQTKLRHQSLLSGGTIIGSRLCSLRKNFRSKKLVEEWTDRFAGDVHSLNFEGPETDWLSTRIKHRAHKADFAEALTSLQHAAQPHPR